VTRRKLDHAEIVELRDPFVRDESVLSLSSAYRLSERGR
jgi:hypothetical protein